MYPHKVPWYSKNATNMHLIPMILSVVYPRSGLVTSVIVSLARDNYPYGDIKFHYNEKSRRREPGHIQVKTDNTKKISLYFVAPIAAGSFCLVSSTDKSGRIKIVGGDSFPLNVRIE